MTAVDSEVLRSGGVAAEVFRPPAGVAEHPAVLWCLPGGGMNRRYFDLDVAGEQGAYSMARWFALHGHTVVTLDHPGVGDSDLAPDIFALTPDVVADADAAAMADIAERLGLGSRPSVGVGHSMGALITCYQQARHGTHHALALLGFGGGGLPDHLTERERDLTDDPDGVRREITELARRRFTASPDERPSRPSILGNDTLAPEVRAALAGATGRMLGACGLTSMIPGASTPQLDAIDVPVFLGVGEHDIARPAHGIPAAFPASRDITLFVLPGTGHSHNAAPNRAELWARLARWVAALGD